MTHLSQCYGYLVEQSIRTHAYSILVTQDFFHSFKKLDLRKNRQKYELLPQVCVLGAQEGSDESPPQMGLLPETITDALAGPVAPILGDTTLQSFLIDWMPLLLIVVLPILCLPFVALGICGGLEQEMKFGARTALRKVSIAARAEVRMGLAAGASRHAAILKKAGFKTGGPSFMKPTSSAVQAGLQKNAVTGGKSPDKSKDRAEELAIKGKAAAGGKTGAKRFY